jgi:hypothetical protein
VLVNEEFILTTQSSKTSFNNKNIINICEKLNDTTLLIDYSVNNLFKQFNILLLLNSTKIDSYLVEFSSKYIKIHAYCVNSSRCFYKIPSNKYIFNFNLNILNNKYSYLCDLTQSIPLLKLDQVKEDNQLSKAYIIDCQIKSSNQLQFYVIHNKTNFNSKNLWFQIEYKLNNDYINDYKYLNTKKDSSFQVKYLKIKKITY